MKLITKIKTTASDSFRFFKEMPKTIIIVFVIYFFQGVIHNLGHPVTPAFVKDMGIADYYFGLYFAAMSLGMLIGGPIWGILGDRGNKRVYIVIGLVIYSIGQFMFGYSGNKYIMLVFRFVSGFGVSASITLLLSHLIENSSSQKRTIYLAWYQAFFVLGSSAGYWLAGSLTDIAFFIDLLHTNDYKVLFLIQAIWNLFHATYIFFLIGKDKVVEVVTEKRESIFKVFKDVRLLNPNLILFLVSLTFISLGAINVSKFIEVYMEDVSLNPVDIGNFVGATGVVSLLATALIVPFVTKLKRDFPIMIIIQALSAIIIFIVFRQDDILLALYTIFMFYVVLKAIYTPLEQHYVSSLVPKGKYGTIMGVRQSFWAVGLVAGPILGGFLYQVNPLLTFDVSAAMFVIGFVLLIIVGSRIKKANLIKENGNT